MIAPGEIAAIGNTLALPAVLGRLTRPEAAPAVHAIYRGRETAVAPTLDVATTAATLAVPAEAQLVFVARQAALSAVRTIRLQRRAVASAQGLFAAVRRARALVAYLFRVAPFRALATMFRVVPRIDACAATQLQRRRTLGRTLADGANGR